MELFDKIYGCYYHIIRHMLAASVDHPLTRQEMEDICRTYGFKESALSILPRIKDGTWALFHETPAHTYASQLHSSPSPISLTNLQKSWLRSLSADPRLSLFLTDEEIQALDNSLKTTEPLYHNKDFYHFDRYEDGDPYDSPEYRTHFHTVLTAIRERKALLIAYEGKSSCAHTIEAAPYQLQYSSKDDKFRLCCLKYSHGRFCQNTLLNLGRIRDCHLSPALVPDNLEQFLFQPVQKSTEPVLLEISGERNSLERCMLHFANYEKHTEYDETRGCWLCSICYDLADETELLIDILSFGPVVRVLGPESFVRQIRQRVKRQHDLFYSEI